MRYLSRYRHRVAISNRRLASTDNNRVAFRWKDYRIDGPERWKDIETGADLMPRIGFLTPSNYNKD